jgi:hypothetical protein
MSEAQNFRLPLLRYGYASAPQRPPKIPKESMTNLLNLTDTTLTSPDVKHAVGSNNTIQPAGVCAGRLHDYRPQDHD